MKGMVQRGTFSGRSLHNHVPAVSTRSGQSTVRVAALFGWGKKKDEEENSASRFSKAAKEEQWRIQQEILAKRRSGAWQKDVDERRARVKRFNTDPEFRKACEEENRQKFLAEKAAAGAEPKFGIIIPLIPIGIPDYDGGERFDLRLPYVDNGWVDEDADIGKQIGRLFGFGKKKKEQGDGDEEGGKKAAAKRR